MDRRTVLGAVSSLAVAGDAPPVTCEYGVSVSDDDTDHSIERTFEIEIAD